jgi:hypothetical protein
MVAITQAELLRSTLLIMTDRSAAKQNPWL